MYEKNIVGTYQLKDVYPVFGYETPTTPEVPAAAPAGEVGGLEAVSGTAGGRDPIAQWRAFSEMLRQRRLAASQAAIGQVSIEAAPPSPDQRFQTAYEADRALIESPENPLLLGLRHHLSAVSHPVPDAVMQGYQEDEVAAAADLLQVREVMTRRVTCVLASTSIEQLAGLCNRRGFSGVPVVNAYHELIGIVTLSDVLAQLLSHEALTTYASIDGGVLMQKALAILEEPVRRYMRQPVVTVRPETSVSEACELMDRHGIRRVVVARGKLVRGIFSARDAVSVLARTRLPASILSGSEA